jgi:hypothetical protein
MYSVSVTAICKNFLAKQISAKVPESIRALLRLLMLLGLAEILTLRRKI